MFIETKFDCHILHSVSKGEKLEHIAHSYASCSFIFPKEHHLLFGGRLHASEGSNYFNQCCALCSYNGMHYPFSRNGVHVESPCESNTSRDAAVSSRERAKRERERERGHLLQRMSQLFAKYHCTQTAYLLDDSA